MTFGLIQAKLPSKVLPIVLLMVALSGYITPANVSAGITKRVYLASGTSWTVPTDWTSSSNTIEAIGGGGHGGNNLNGGGGGGGGAYAKISNLTLTPSTSVTYRVVAAADTVFNSSATTCAGSPTPSVCAKGGATASGSTGGAGGLASGSIGTTKYDGGTGESFAGGGGGAAGPFGAGEIGYAFQGGTGGNGSGGGGGGAGSSYCGDLPIDGGFGESGYPGYEYDTIPGHGSGGGGGPGGTGDTGFSGGNGGAGGAYGGGAGGGGARCGGSGSGGSGSTGSVGLITITYDSTDSGSTSNAKVKIIGGYVKIIGGRVLIR